MRGPGRTLLGSSPFHGGPGAPPDVISKISTGGPLLTLKRVCAGARVGETCFVGFGNTILRGFLCTGANFSLGPDTKAGQEAGGLELDL